MPGPGTGRSGLWKRWRKEGVEGRTTPAWMRASHAELFAEIEAADVRVVHDILSPALHQDLARIDDIGAVGEAERLAHVMVGDQHADAAIGQVADQRLNVADRDRIDAGER